MILRFAKTSLALVVCSGCISHAQIEMSAAQSMDAIAAEMQRAVEEYHRDLSLLDDQREAAAINAFLTRISAAGGNAERQQQDADVLIRALARIRQDRATALNRYYIAMDNVDLLLDISSGLNRIGLEQLGLNRQVEHYLEEIISKTAVGSQLSAISNPQY